MNNELLKYLTDEEKKTIAQRVFEEEIRKSIQEDFAKRDPSIFDHIPTLYDRLLSKYINEMNLYNESFIPIFRKRVIDEIEYIIKRDKDDTSNRVTLDSIIDYKLREIGEEVISESKDDLKPIIREKVFKCCNETLLISFISKIIKEMNINKAIEKIMQETEGNKK